jgi:hypothetical protein
MSTVNLGFDTTSRKDLLKEGAIRRLFDTTASAIESVWPNLVKGGGEKAKDYIYRDRQFAGLGLATKVADGANSPIDAPILGNEKTYTQARYMLGFRMTHGMEMFNKYDLWAKQTKSLARNMKVTKDVEVHKMFNGPTSTTLDCGTGFDGLAIANDTHTGLDSSTTNDNYDNYLNASLSYSALESARYYFKTLVDDRGIIIGGNPSHLVIEPTLWPTAAEILKSGLKAGENSNTKNIFENYLQIFEDRYLTSTTAWFVMDKNNDLFDFHVYTAQEPELVIKDAPDTTRDRIATSEQWFTYGWGDARCVFWGKA